MIPDKFLNRIVCMDALTYLQSLPDNSVHCIVTSPPYFGLRNYNVDGQIGLEDTPQAFVARLVGVFREARRVLRDDGVCWLNLGDSYAANRGSGAGKVGKKQRSNAGSLLGSLRVPGGLKEKDLIGIPWRVAFALQDDGWWLRSDIIWHKPNPMPSSVTDRCTTSHEYVFMLTKSARYFYDADAIRETSIHAGKVVSLGEKSLSKGSARAANIAPSGNGAADSVTVKDTRNRRSVWTIPTEGKPFQHFAMFPQALIEPMIRAGCPVLTCADCGAGWVRQTERKSASANAERDWQGVPLYQANRGGHAQEPKKRGAVGTPTIHDHGFFPACDCYEKPNANNLQRGIVLDFFMGSGTTAVVAQRLGRSYTGCDLNAEYVALANKRLEYRGDDKRMVKEQAAGVQQLDMFADAAPGGDNGKA